MADITLNDLSNSYGGMSLDDLLKQFAPSAADMKSAQGHALMMTGLGILAGRGPLQNRIGQGGILGLNSYNDEVKNMQAQRNQNLVAAAQTQKLGKDMQTTQMGLDAYKSYLAAQQGGGSPMQPPSIPPGGAGMGGGTSSLFGPTVAQTDAAASASRGAAPSSPSTGASSPRQLLSNLMLAQGVAKGDITGAYNAIYKAPTALRAGAGYIDETGVLHPGMSPPPGYMFNQQTGTMQEVPGAKEAFSAQAGAVTGATEQAKAERDLIPVPMGDGTTQQMTRANAISALQNRRGANLSVGGPGQSVNVQGADPAQITRMDSDIASGGQSGAFSSSPQAMAPNARFGLPPLGLGRTANPVALKSAEAEAGKSGENLGNQATQIDTEARAAQDLMARTQEMRTLLSRMNTGAASPARMEAAKWLSAAGLPDSATNAVAGGDLPAMQALGKQAVQGAFAAARQALGAGQRITQNEILTMAANSPNISLTKPAINAMLDFQDGVSKWQTDRQQAKDAWVSGNGSYKGFEADWNKNHPLTDYVPSKEKLEGALFPNGVPASAAAPAAQAAPQLTPQAQNNATARAMLQKEIAEGNPDVLAKRRAQGWLQ